ncbi:hypothetical protein PpBr36_04925 [Pyricularia pennisetigena]|uniref:hypothetical protein n=1 Tax=Pyricularia pennisetigena TaxID=1578925 RepID=UPI00114D6246|nr:hypothetical protein PpBr36_04925 [Pyricularia pennisetigena]TLS27256.1 hypothetical protein PpBr36_04925 [Pyricularia pennisetigena]
MRLSTTYLAAALAVVQSAAAMRELLLTPDSPVSGSGNNSPSTKSGNNSPSTKSGNNRPSRKPGKAIKYNGCQVTVVANHHSRAKPGDIWRYQSLPAVCGYWGNTLEVEQQSA